MQLNTQQKKLLLELIKDQENSTNLYKPGPYWSYKCKKATNWMIKYGFSDFRGLNNPVGSSFADNIILDKRNEFGFGLKSIIANKISRLPLIKKIFDSQIKLTRNNINQIIDLQRYIYSKSSRVRYLLQNYIVKDTVNFGSMHNFRINEFEYANKYLEFLNLIDLIKNILFLRSEVVLEQIYIYC